MTRVLDLGALQVGDRVQDTLLVLEAEQKSFDGGAYTVLTFGNATGRLPSAPFFDKDLPYVEGVRRGHVVQVIGEIAEYRGRRQLRVTAPLRLLPDGAVDLSQLLPTVGDVTRYWEVLDGWRREIKKPRLAHVLALFYEDDEFRARYGRCPASINGHHAAIGGLVKHTAEVAAIARTIGRGSGADPDLVLAGVLLHDIGKLESYRWDGVFEYSDGGHLLGHVVLGALLLDRRLPLETPSPCTAAARAVLLPPTLPHHGRPQVGRPAP